MKAGMLDALNAINVYSREFSDMTHSSVIEMSVLETRLITKLESLLIMFIRNHHTSQLL